MTNQQRDDLKLLVSGNLDEQLGDLSARVGQYNQEAETWIDKLPLSQQERDDLVAMMAAGDTQGVEAFFQQRPGVAGQPVQDAIVAVAGMNQGVAELYTASQNMASPEAFGDVLEAFATAQQAANDGLLAITTDAADRSRIRDLGYQSSQRILSVETLNGLLAGLDGGATDPWAGGVPFGDIPNLFVPGLPADSYYPIPGGLICGTGGVGENYVMHRTVSDACGFHICPDEAIPEASGRTAAASSILISNPQENGGTINFLLDEKSESLAAGDRREFPATTSKLIRFDRGDGGGAAKYTLKPGSAFNFVVKDGGWDLRSQRVEVVLDNSDNESAFHYVVDNEVVSIPAGATGTHNAERPIEIRFDRGNGEESRKILDSGRYEIGVNLDSMSWDLHPASERALASLSQSEGSSSPMIGD